jgi:hypothetical protein
LAAGLFFAVRLLSSYVREESHEAGPLYSDCELALARCCDSGPLLALDASVRIHEFLEDLRIFVVDVLNAVLLEEVLFHFRMVYLLD